MESEIDKRMKRIKNKIAVLSGKGGVGKSTVCAQIAISLFNKGFKVGVLDIDLCGPSIPKIFGIDNEEVHHSDNGWVPIIVDKKGLYCMSIAPLLKSKNDAVYGEVLENIWNDKQFFNY